ncbi:MAG: carboxypeptidase-like regulatory domain-containing protein, partial [Terriglobales bacterium]
MKCSLGIVLLAAMSLSALLSAQTNRGGLSGAVRDASGGAVAGAQVTVRNVGTNQTWHLTTSKTGDYALPDLEPAVYALTVAAPGFGSVRF